MHGDRSRPTRPRRNAPTAGDDGSQPFVVARFFAHGVHGVPRMRPRFPREILRLFSCTHVGCARRFAERTIMNMQRSRIRRCIRTLFAVSCAIVIAPGNTWAAVVDAADACRQASPADGAVSDFERPARFAGRSNRACPLIRCSHRFSRHPRIRSSCSSSISGWPEMLV